VIVTRTVAETRAALAGLARPLGFVPTMGALHAGHLSLVAEARRSCATVAASVFVNPTQFGPSEDFAAYPRDEVRDFELLAAAGADVVFAPAAAELYPAGFSTEVHVADVTARFEGAQRPDHFGGVALVVTKLLNIVRPDVAVFGQKDAQQLAVVRRLARDLDVPVTIVGAPTVREPDGLAMSSRNAYLSPEERAVAPSLYRALCAGAEAARRPGAQPHDVVAAAEALLATDTDGPCFVVDYLAVVDAGTFAPVAGLGPGALLVAAARLGKTRLLDNLQVVPSAYPTPDATA
jgi:pantoate--beta-alanine ligase